MSIEYLNERVSEIKKIHYSEEVQRLLNEYFKTSKHPLLRITLNVNKKPIILTMFKEKLEIRLCYTYDLYDPRNIEKNYIIDALTEKRNDGKLAVDVLYDYVKNELKKKLSQNII